MSFRWASLPSVKPDGLVGSTTAYRAGPVLVGVFWFLLVSALIYWIWGGPDPTMFTSPDEAINKYAAELMLETGEAKVKPPVEDAEDLLHMRGWVTVNGSAMPAYPPATYVLHSILMSIPVLGRHLVPLTTAIGVACFAVGVYVLGTRRRWISAFAPAVAFPALYWAFRPWHNIAFFVALVSVAFLCWASWRLTRRLVWLGGVGLWLALAACVRPDYAHVVFLCGLVACLVEARQGEHKAVFVVLACAGAASLLVMFALNSLTIGDPWTFAYELQPDWGPSAASELPMPILKLTRLFFPFGWPSLPDIATQMGKYWIGMGPTWLLSLSWIVSTAFMLRSRPKREVIGYIVMVFIAALFVASRLTEGVGFEGATEDFAYLSHSLPRYWAAIYLFAAVPVCLIAMNATGKKAWLPAAVVVVVTATLGGQYLWIGGGPESVGLLPERISWMRYYVTSLDGAVPPQSLMYSKTKDKMIWSSWQPAIIPQPFEPQRVAASMAGAVSAGEMVYATELSEDDVLPLAQALALHGLCLYPTDVNAIYRVEHPDSVARFLESYGCGQARTEEPEAFVSGTYVVREGDSLSSLAVAWGVDVDQLLAVNGVGHPSLVRVGQSLRIPVQPTQGLTPTDTQLACFFERRQDILVFYRANGQGISQANYRFIFYDWWLMTTERDH